MIFPSIPLSEESAVSVDSRILTDVSFGGNKRAVRLSRRSTMVFALVGANICTKVFADSVNNHFLLTGNAYFDYVWLDGKTYSVKYIDTPQITQANGGYWVILVSLRGRLK